MNVDCPNCNATLYLPSIGVCYCYCGQRLTVNMMEAHKTMRLLGYPTIRVEIDTRGGEDEPAI